MQEQKEERMRVLSTHAHKHNKKTERSLVKTKCINSSHRLHYNPVIFFNQLPALLSPRSGGAGLPSKVLTPSMES